MSFVGYQHDAGAAGDVAVVGHVYERSFDGAVLYPAVEYGDEELGGNIDQRVEATRATDVLLPLDRIATTFSLGPLSRQLLSLALCSETDSAIRRLYMYAWNDFTRRWPTWRGLEEPGCDETF